MKEAYHGTCSYYVQIKHNSTRIGVDNSNAIFILLHTPYSPLQGPSLSLSLSSLQNREEIGKKKNISLIIVERRKWDSLALR